MKRNFKILIVISCFLLIIYKYYPSIIINYIAFALWLFPSNEDRNGELFKVILTIIGGTGVLYSLIISYKRMQATNRGLELQSLAINKQSEQLMLSRDGQVDERFKNAIEHLGSEKEPVILGGIAELHQIATVDSPKYSEIVFNILTSYIRTSAHRKIKADNINRTIIQTIIDYLFKIEENRTSPYQGMHPDMSFTNLNSINFDNVMFEKAKLSFCLLPSMKNTTFNNCDIRSSNFIMTDLNNVVFDNCKVFDAYFKGAKLNEVKVKGSDGTFRVHFLDTKFSNCLFSNIKSYQSNFLGCEFNNSHFKYCDLLQTILNTSCFNAVEFYQTKVTKSKFQAAGFKNTLFEGETFMNNFSGASQNIEFFSYCLKRRTKERIGEKTDLTGTNLLSKRNTLSEIKELDSENSDGIIKYYNEIQEKYDYKRPLDNND